MSIIFCLFIILLSSIISGEIVTNHSEIFRAGRSDTIESGLNGVNTTNLISVPDVKNSSNTILLNGTTLSELIWNITGNGTNTSNPLRTGRRIGQGNGNVSNSTPSANITSLIAAGNNPDILSPDQRLSANQILLSRNQQYALRISRQCNMEIIRVQDLVPIWSTNTSSPITPCSVMMKKNGVLSLLDRNLHQLWKSDSNEGEDPASLRLGDDGNMTITDQAWTATWKTNSDWRRDHINGGEIVSDLQPIATSNRIYTLHITDACQLAARKMGIGNPVWSIGNPVNNTRCRLGLDKFGVVSLQSDKGDIIWNNDYTAGIGDEPFQLRLLSNGSLTLTSAHVPVWLIDQNGITTLA